MSFRETEILILFLKFALSLLFNFISPDFRSAMNGLSLILFMSVITPYFITCEKLVEKTKREIDELEEDVNELFRDVLSD